MNPLLQKGSTKSVSRLLSQSHGPNSVFRSDCFSVDSPELYTVNRIHSLSYSSHHKGVSFNSKTIVIFPLPTSPPFFLNPWEVVVRWFRPKLSVSCRLSVLILVQRGSFFFF